MSEISLEVLDKAEVLAALYNASRPLGMGFLHYDSAPMTREEAAGLLERHTYFDYLKGRVMKIDLSGDNLDPWLYDRDNGQGAALRAIEALRAGDIGSIESAHAAGTTDAIEEARMLIGQSTRREGNVVILGMEDVADIIVPVLDGIDSANGE